MNIQEFHASLIADTEISVERSDLTLFTQFNVMTMSRDIQSFYCIEIEPGMLINFVANNDDFDLNNAENDIVRVVYLSSYDDESEAIAMLMMQFLVDQFDDERKTCAHIAKRIASFRHVILRDDALTLAQAAKALDCSVKTVKNLCAKSILLRASDDYNFITNDSIALYKSTRIASKRKTREQHAAIHAARVADSA